MKKSRFISVLLGIFMMLVSNTLRADDVISQFRILGGELSNSAVTSVKDIDEVLPRMKALGLNTVLVPVYWEFLEPVEGQMDFTLIDRTVDVARQQDLKIVPLWFGAWKNSMLCYAPAWFKRDVKRFPRAVTAEGKPLEIASCFSDNVLQADQKAFSALMHHIAEKDSQHEVVIMMQIENEIGMLESARDHSPLAEKSYRQPVVPCPQDVIRNTRQSVSHGLPSYSPVPKVSHRVPPRPMVSQLVSSMAFDHFPMVSQGRCHNVN